MVNVKGVNGWGQKNYPPDDELRAFLQELSTRKLTVTDKLTRIQLKFGLVIGQSQFFKLQKRFAIRTVRKPGISAEEAEAAVLAQIQADTNAMRGPLFIKETLQEEMIFIPRDKIVALMKRHAPEGFDHCFPGSKRCIVRKPLTSVGPFREVSADGHEKLNRQALQMGNLSIPIYAYRDKWSGTILDLRAIPDSRRAGAIGHVYLDLIHKWSGIPIQLTTDHGSEIGWETTIQSIFREFYAPDIDMDIFPPSVALQSVHNTVIEGMWRRLKEKSTANVKDIILQGKFDHRFRPHVREHHDLFYWIFVPLIQQDLDTFARWWNNHTIRKQNLKLMPSGHIPFDALQNPSLFDGHSCLVTVPEAAQVEMRNILVDAVGPPEAYLSWYSPEFGLQATRIYEALGSPPLSFNTAWDVFTNMARVIGL